MQLAIMQPYFFPYIGYFSLMHKTKKMILLDTVQFQRKSWMARNRIYNPNEPFTYIHIPTNKAALQQTVQTITINHAANWQQHFLKQLTVYKQAPFYEETIALLTSIIHTPTTALAKFHQQALQKINNYLNIKCDITVFSDMQLNIHPPAAPDEWSLHICQALQATSYFNPPGGTAFFDARKFERANVELLFLQNDLQPYKQLTKTFTPAFSIIDVLMFNSPKQTLALIKQYKTFEMQEVS